MDYQVKWSGQTTNATATEIYTPTGQRMAIAASTAYNIKGTAIAVDTSSIGTHKWEFDALIKNVAGNVSFVGTPIVTDLMSDSGTEAWTLSIAADDTNNAFAVTVTGASGRTIDWNIYGSVDVIGSAVTATTVSPIAAAIVTVATVKDFLNISSSDTTVDNFLQTWINQQSLRIEGPDGINNKVVAQTITNELQNGNGRARLRPWFYPIIDIGAVGASDAQKLASVQYDNDGTWTDIETDVDNIIFNNPITGFANQNNSYNIELLEEVFPEGTRNIRLTYQAGYSTTPADLVVVCLERVAELYQDSYVGGKRFGIQTFSKSEGGGSLNTTYKDFTKRHKDMMKPYRRTQY